MGSPIRLISPSRRRNGAARLVVCGAVAVFALSGCRSGQTNSRSPARKPTAHPISASARTRAARPCAQFNAAVAPYAVGAGLAQLIKQATAHRDARTTLARQLDALPLSAQDRRSVTIYTRRLSADNRWLDAAIERAKRGDVPGAYEQLGHWQEELKVEEHLVRELRLPVCP
jgi:hypothetical protein